MAVQQRQTAQGRAGIIGAWLMSGLVFAPFLLPGIASAQDGSEVNETTTIDRDRVDRLAPEVPLPTPPVASPEKPVEVAPEVGGAAGVQLVHIRYEGSTLPVETLDQATAPFINQPLTRDILQQVANAVSAAYAQSDVAFYGVSIPAQNPARGELLVRVLEGRVTTYRLASETPSMPTRLIGKQAQRLIDDTPTHKSTLERTLSLLRDIPGQTVQAQVKPTDVPGELALDLDVKRKQVELTLNINNRGVTNVTSATQMQAIVAINGLLREGDATRISGYIPFNPDRYQQYSLSHSTPIGSNGTTLTVSGAYVRTLTVTNIRGDAKQGGIVLSHPLIRSYRRNLTMSLGLDGTNSENYFLDTQFGGFKTRAVRLSTSWSSTGKKGGYAAAATISQGLKGLGADPFDGYSEADFTKANLQLTAVRKLGESMTIRTGLRGQYSNSRLPTTERFSIGGPGGGAAFYQGIVTADSAASGNLELSWKVLGPSGSPLGLTLFGFADGALGHSKARPSYKIAERDYSLASAGGGLRVSPLKGWVGSAQLAFPLKAPLAGTDDKPRFIFSISKVL